MNLKTAVILLCENFIIDKSDRISVINIFDYLWVKDFPFRYPFWVYSHLLGWEGKHQLKLTYKDFQGEIYTIREFEFRLQSNKLSLSHFEKLDIDINQYGEYTFYLYIDDKGIAEKYLAVVPPIDKE
jgi:hypothetical protein